MDLIIEPWKQAIDDFNAFLVVHLGEAGAALIWFLLLATGVVLAGLFLWYRSVLAQGSANEGTRERQIYNNLRASLAAGGSLNRVYGRLLTEFLDRIDRLFREADNANLGVFRRAFWLQGSYPLWTSAAFDRCLLLALIYPVLSVLLIWAASGHVAEAGAVLGLSEGAPAWQRWVVVGALVIAVTMSFWSPTRSRGRRKYPRLAAIALPLIAAFAVGWAGALDQVGILTAVPAFALAFTVAVHVAVNGIGAAVPPADDETPV
jgi:hypothetical protein